MLNWDLKEKNVEIINVGGTDLLSNTASIGNQYKWRVDNRWVKGDTQGYEGLAEEIVSILADNIKKIDYVKYRTCYIEKEDGVTLTGCYSDNMFKDKGEAFITFHKLYEQYGIHFEQTLKRKSTEEMVKGTIEFIQDKYKVDVTDYLIDTLYLDRLTLNEDRHASNLGIIKNIEDNTYKTAPIFDSGLAFLARSDYWRDFSIHVALKKVKYRPFGNKQLDALGKMSSRKLIIDKDRLDENIENYTNDIYPASTVNKVKRILRDNLNIMEGKLWTRE